MVRKFWGENVGIEPPLKARLNILSLALSWALWCCLCCTHVIFNRVEPPLKARLNILSLALPWALWYCLCCTHVIFNRVEPPLKHDRILFHNAILLIIPFEQKPSFERNIQQETREFAKKNKRYKSSDRGLQIEFQSPLRLPVTTSTFLFSSILSLYFSAPSILYIFSFVACSS